MCCTSRKLGVAGKNTKQRRGARDSVPRGDRQVPGSRSGFSGKISSAVLSTTALVMLGMRNTTISMHITMPTNDAKWNVTTEHVKEAISNLQIRGDVYFSARVWRSPAASLWFKPFETSCKLRRLSWWKSTMRRMTFNPPRREEYDDFLDAYDHNC